MRRLREHHGDDDLSRPMWSLLERQVDHLADLTHDVLDVTRIEQGTLHLHKVPTVLQDVVHQAMAVAMPLADGAGLTVTLSLPDSPIVVEADALRLTQVVANLVDNACKFTSPGGRIEVHAESAEGVARLIVSDTGVGISAEDLPYVFDGFWRRGARVQTEGIGVGLTLVRSIVKLHEGVVEARSDGPGRGSTFVVDDNPDLVDALADALGEMGMEVATATDGRRILDLMHSFRPTVVILDLTMAPLDGYQVAEMIRQHSEYDTVALVALSGRNPEGDTERAGGPGFTCHLVKPVSMEQLRGVLASVPTPTP